MLLKKIVYAYRYDNLKKRLGVAPGCCLYKESCSKYAERIINEKGEIKAAFLILQRLLLCNSIGYKKIGKHLYEELNICKKKRAQRKANLLLIYFVLTTVVMQIFIFKMLHFYTSDYIKEFVDKIKY